LYDNGNGKAKLDVIFDIPQDLKDQGIEGFRIRDKNAILKLVNGPIILFPFYLGNYVKSMDMLRDKLAVYKVDDRLAEFYCIKITDLLLIQLDRKTSKHRQINPEEEQAKKETQFIIDSIERLRKDYKDIPYNIWEIGRKKRYENLYRVVQKNIPKAWESIELAITVKGVKRIDDVTLPLIVIIQGNPATWKTLGMEMLRRWPDVCFKDKISPKSWVSHAAKDNKDELDAIDLIREIKDVSHSGLHGNRGIDGALMFTMLGAVVHVPPKVYKVLSTLGPKVYFYNTEFQQATKKDIINEIMDEKFEYKKRAIKEALFSHLQWLEVCPLLIEIRTGNAQGQGNDTDQGDTSKYTVINRVIRWDKEKDDSYTIEKIAELALFLAKLRGNAYTYQTKLISLLANDQNKDVNSDIDETQSSSSRI
jgi:hypothetical protein